MIIVITHIKNLKKQLLVNLQKEYLLVYYKRGKAFSGFTPFAYNSFVYYYCVIPLDYDYTYSKFKIVKISVETGRIMLKVVIF